ncbi:hypothetical protein [Sebaldella sp. S0638]|uniref:hypothetical protein n=1 Tax=Sebaldella sp. S0638 TaxID=2957809 RepID=UPI0020A18ED3|nr:hypothetical protein [Sebaldella sp. S0638]MCP1225505.1 hypothetical protein [Sebaldella sp. S0638]
MSVFDMRKEKKEKVIPIEEVKEQTYFNFRDYDIEENIAEKIIKKEDSIRNNLTQLDRNTRELSKSLYEIQQLLVNNKKGGFRAYLEYVNISKDTAYRFIDKWNLFLETKQAKVFELPHNTVKNLKKEVQELKKDNEHEKIVEIVEILESENIEEKLKEYKETKEESNITVIESSEEIEKRIKKIDKEIVKLTERITKLEIEKTTLEKKL